ncbi:acetyl-CoA carboxylase carboxyl transferase subunit alpha [Thermomicrobium sp. 4228-Ro]|uniref:acetyl-CoA carboxylase carboxyl transferase subunit alpha n=1 Tax=Thermomicrobium sp. 4228-Ro TaxID=2993937 RepID=UPI002248AC3C|nr:acetyl-CoA carboxylase carboxyl transferase subunit alpha [Thermomicrobium sp. 4228-Ro]MCX2726041.1 acetyl-CoA carboxylase carboxyl transferase subunit alpha [Thermomicrobium sp. 4228-Ro]
MADRFRGLEESRSSGTVCPKCGVELTLDESYQRYRVCGHCGYHFTISADERIRLLVDPGSFEEFNRHLVSVDPLLFSDRLPYRKRILQAREETGLREAVVTGIGRVRGHEVVLAVLDFRFLGGSMGSVVGEKITLAFERAVERRLPIVTVSASGGARMQEGVLSLVQMAKTTAAAKRAHDSNVPFISVLTHPTTGGIYASFANQGDIILAEPGALIGFAGPRVVKETAGREPLRSHSAEFLFEHGFVDQVVDRRRLRDTIGLILRLVKAEGEVVPRSVIRRSVSEDAVPLRAWDLVQLARHPERPTTLDLIRRISPQFVELHGDRLYGDDPAIVAGLGEIAGQGVVIIGHERGHGDPSRRNGQALPEGYRKAMRLMELAARLRLPVVTLIDTPGVYLGEGAEERGIASALSQCLAMMSVLPVPTVALIIGEGGSGGAIALAVADRVLMLENAIYSVISPEGAAAILYRDASRAPEVAESLKITARDLLRLEVIDGIVPEPEGGAHRDPDYAAVLVLDAIVEALADLRDISPERLVKERYRKFRRLGQTNTYIRELVAQEVTELSSLIGRTLGSLRERLPFGREEDETEERPVTVTDR